MSVSTSATDAVEAVYDILSGLSDSDFTNDAPGVERAWEATQQTKLNRVDPYLYVYSPIDGDYRQIDGDYTVVDERETVAVDVWVLQDTAAANNNADTANTYASDVFDQLSNYGFDNESQTTFYRIRPVSIDDRKAEHTVRSTDHFVVSLTIELDKLTDTGP